MRLENEQSHSTLTPHDVRKLFDVFSRMQFGHSVEQSTQRTCTQCYGQTSVEPPAEDTCLTTHSQSLGTAVVDLWRAAQHMPSGPFDSSSSMPFPQGPLESALYKALRSLSGEALLLPAVYSIAARI